MENRPVPHVIKSMIESLLNPNERPHIRENYYTTLLNIRDVLGSAITEYELVRIQALNERERKKIRA